MKCPICESELKNTSSGKFKCFHCGFDDVRTEFINDEEVIFWQTYVVKPCKYAYRLNRILQVEVDTLRKKVAKLTTAGSVSGSEDIAKTELPAQAKTVLKDGWNYDDPIAHPNSAIGNSSYNISFNISNVKSHMTSSSTATITFLVKKASDKKGSSSTDPFWVRYRVKDSTGVILLNETIYVNGLQVGDVTRESIKLTGVAAGEHTIDFVSYS